MYILSLIFLSSFSLSQASSQNYAAIYHEKQALESKKDSLNRQMETLKSVEAKECAKSRTSTACKSASRALVEKALEKSSLYIKISDLQRELKVLSTYGPSAVDYKRLKLEIESGFPELAVNAMGCLSGYGQSSKTVKELQRSALEVLSGIDAGFVLFDTRGLPSKKCTSEEELNCWRKVNDGFFFSSPEGFDLDALCIVNAGKPGWDLFPKSVDEYRKAFRNVKSAVNKCYPDLNREKASDLQKFLTKKRPAVVCNNTDLNSSDKSCGLAKLATGQIHFFHPQRAECAGMDRTIFHETLHIFGKVDNQSVEDHNKSTTHKDDAVYACEGLCFGDVSKEVGKKGCLACVSPDQAHRCKSFPTN